MMDVNWLAVCVGAVLAYALGALWYSNTLFGKKWRAGIGISETDTTPMMPAMVSQAVATFLLAWVIGITERTDDLAFAVLIAVTIAVILKAGGLFIKKSKYAIMVDSGFILAMVFVMIVTHAFL